MGLRKIKHRRVFVWRNCVVGGAAISLLLSVFTIIGVVSFPLKSRIAYEWNRGGQMTADKLWYNYYLNKNNTSCTGGIYCEEFTKDSKVAFTIKSTHATSAAGMTNSIKEQPSSNVSFAASSKSLKEAKKAYLAPRECEESSVSNIDIQTETFQRVEENDHIYLFSAYYDEGLVRIMGISDLNYKTIFCHLWYEGEAIHSPKTISYRAVTETGKMEIFHRSSHRYSDVFVFCQTGDSQKPVAASVSTKKCQPYLNMLRVQTLEKTDLKVNFTICVQPFHYRYANILAFVEWIELNLLLGADYFTFYNYSLNPKLNHVLEWYSKRGYAEVIQWPLPMRVEKNSEIAFCGQILAQNDCHYRNKFKSVFTVHIDLDEFIIPRTQKERTWHQVIARLPVADMYTFRNTFFKLEWADTNMSFPGKDVAVSYGLNTLLKLVREEKIFPAYQRSKFMARTEGVISLAVHDSIKTKHNNKFVVPINDGLVQHYRNWDNPEDPKRRTTDTTIMKYKDDLIRNVQKTWKFLT